MNNPYIYDPKTTPVRIREPRSLLWANQYVTKNPIKPMATRASKRNERLARAISMAGDALTTACLAVGFYALVVFIFGVTP